jgi:hypothetical protein
MLTYAGPRGLKGAASYRLRAARGRAGGEGSVLLALLVVYLLYQYKSTNTDSLEEKGPSSLWAQWDISGDGTISKSEFLVCMHV